MPWLSYIMLSKVKIAATLVNNPMFCKNIPAQADEAFLNVTKCRRRVYTLQRWKETDVFAEC